MHRIQLFHIKNKSVILVYLSVKCILIVRLEPDIFVA